MKTVITQVFMLACMLVGAAWARADENNIKVTVVAILASTTDKKIDKELKDFAQEMRKKDPTLTGFVVERSSSQSMKVGEKATFTLLDKKSVEVELREKNPKTNRVSLTITPPTLGEIAYTICCEKYFPVCTGYQTKDGRKLIVAVMVAPCGKK
jgi:hypothetical protein